VICDGTLPTGTIGRYRYVHVPRYGVPVRYLLTYVPKLINVDEMMKSEIVRSGFEKSLTLTVGTILITNKRYGTGAKFSIVTGRQYFTYRTKVKKSGEIAHKRASLRSTHDWSVEGNICYHIQLCTRYLPR